MLRSEKGLTLLEVIAAMAVLSIVVLAFLSLSQANLFARHTTDQRQTALNLAEKQLNEQRAYIAANYSSLSTNYPSGTPYAPPVSVQDGSVPYYVYTQQQLLSTATTPDASSFQNEHHVSLQAIVRLRDAANPAQTDRCLLTVTVYWSE